eukprot:764058_1
MDNKPRRPVRVYMDGCFDITHSGHYNAIRQAKALGDILVVGVCSDEEITKFKRNPIRNIEQRVATVQACKWVDEVVSDAPYEPSRAFVEQLNCDYVAHGDDCPDFDDPNCDYRFVLDKVKLFPRTPGVSTTHLICKLLDAANHKNGTEPHDSTQWSSFVASTTRIAAFSNTRVATKDDKVVYVDGAFDLFHIGHVAALKKAKELGTFLYVGLFDDATIEKIKDDVIIGSPWKLTSEFIKSVNISVVVTTQNTNIVTNEPDRYNVAKELGVYQELKMDMHYTTDMFMQTVVKRYKEMALQNKSRVEKEKQHWNNNLKCKSEKTKQKRLFT